MKILVTGASGFVGQALIKKLISDQSHDPIALYRKIDKKSLLNCVAIEAGDMEKIIDWSPFLEGVDVIIHTAARVHVMNNSLFGPTEEYTKINVNATLKLASDAEKCGVRRFIFLSSVKVSGEYTLPGAPFSEADTPNPVGSYALSKLAAEVGLMSLAKKSKIEIVCIRPTLIYGRGVKGNFLSIIRWLKKGIPMPFGGINNLRSFLSIDNLVDFIVGCISHPRAKNEVFLISDGHDISTSELLKLTASALGKSIILISVPQFLYQIFFVLFGKKEVYKRLTENLQVDISKANSILGWTPLINIEEGLKNMFEDNKRMAD